jgi:hypothetical protein
MNNKVWYYICKPPQPNNPPKDDYYMIKFGIYKVNLTPEAYVVKRYGKETVLKGCYSFDEIYEMDIIKKNVETPILNNLRCRGDLCEIVRSKKEHFWVHKSNYIALVCLVEDLVMYYGVNNLD